MTLSPVVETLAGLVRINSINPAYEGGTPEAALVEYIEQFFTSRSIRTWRQEVFPGRPNLIAAVPGRQSSRRLILEAHTDTASVKGMTIPPFEPRVEGGRLYGRGACDTKGGLAAMMHALAAVAESGRKPPCEVWLVAAADEEYSYRGVVKLCEGITAHGAVVAEPTSMRLVTATKGCVRFKVHTRGRAAHSSKPHLGVNAISGMARVILAIEKDCESLKTRSHPLLGSGTCNIGIVRGGTQVNIVPDECSIEIDRRLLPGEEPRATVEHFREVVKAVPGVDARVDAPMLEDLPLDTRIDEKIVLAASAALADLGLSPAPAGVPYGSDASKLAAAGVPSVVFGPGSIDQAHAAVEYVDLSEVEQASEFYRRIMLVFE
ncbi:MAG: M20 family metallopeptidase [Bryobacteraceae bacterium]|nr:M20 family metallopeptidase [Bryobacterales bacterium]MEB2362722.1 M20 family metallopeptidase [Bryobacterales bacterium]NUN02172.1 M20 family metallopeptidase [Bryobacteraceae bacterium]